MRKRHFFIITLCGIVAQMLSSCGADAFMRKGDKALALGEYYVAAENYRKAYAKTPASERDLRGERALKVGKAYAAFNSHLKALAGYRNAARYGKATAEDSLQLGRLLLRNGEYRAAEAVFTALQQSMPDNVLVKNGLESARKAPEWKQEGSRYTVKRVDLFNSRRDDYSPVLAGEDYSRLYFTSTRNDALGDEPIGKIL